MKVNLELLYHYRCDHCQSWWSIADIPPTVRSYGHMKCPHCADDNRIDEIEYVLNKAFGDVEVDDITEVLRKVIGSLPLNKKQVEELINQLRLKEAA